MLRRTFLLTPLLTLGACSGRVDVAVTGDAANPIIHITLAPPAIVAPAVQWVRVSEFVRTQQPPREMWSFSAPRALSGELHVTYGIVPQRFHENTPAQRLVADTDYEVTTAGGSYTGRAYFRISDGRVV